MINLALAQDVQKKLELIAKECNTTTEKVVMDAIERHIALADFVQLVNETNNEINETNSVTIPLGFALAARCLFKDFTEMLLFWAKYRRLLDNPVLYMDFVEKAKKGEIDMEAIFS